MGLLLAVIIGGALIAAYRRRTGREGPEHRPSAGRASDALGAKIATLREETEQLRHNVGELAERVDFAERLLAQRRDTQRLNPPSR